MPFRPAAITMSAEAIPFAIAPVYSGYCTPYCAMNACEPAPRLAIGTARTRPAEPPAISTTTSRSVDRIARRRAASSLARAVSAFVGASVAIGTEAGASAAPDDAGSGSGRYGAYAAASTALISRGSAFSCSQRRRKHAPRSTCRLVS